MRILVVGAGAVGGYFGGRLAAAGKDVTFLVRPKYLERLRAEGVRIVSPHGDVEAHAKYMAAEEIAEPFDLLILCVKAYSLEAALQDCTGAVGEATVILPLLNGMRHIDVLANRFGGDHVIGGVCLIASEYGADGRIVHLSEIHRLVYGERDGRPSPRIAAIHDEMQGAGFESRASDNIMLEMWEKWVMLASLGATTCLLRGSVGEVEAVAGGVEVARAILAEANAISRASGFEPGEAFLGRTEKMLTTRGSSLTSSMYRDMTKGAAVEVEQILGDLVARGREVGVEAPLLQAACVNLRVYAGRLLS
jgi:2-dehydropantoate 2-reductase